MLELAADCLYRMEYRPMQDWSQRALNAARSDIVLGHGWAGRG